MSDASRPPVRRSPRWMTVLLVVSLSVNLLVAGLFVGAMLRHGGERMGDRDRSELSRDLGRTPFVAALGPADRGAIADRLRREAGPLRANREELRERFDRLLAALRADSFDRAEVEALLAQQREAGLRRLEIGEEAILERLEEMSVEERRAYADRLDRSLRRRP